MVGSLEQHDGGTSGGRQRGFGRTGRRLLFIIIVLAVVNIYGRLCFLLGERMLLRISSFLFFKAFYYKAGEIIFMASFYGLFKVAILLRQSRLPKIIIITSSFSYPVIFSFFSIFQRLLL